MLLVFTFESAGEQEKFEFLYQKYKNLCLKKAYDILGDYMLAEDAVSEAYIRIYKNLHKIEDPASNRSIAFVVTIAKNAALTMLARQKSTSQDELDENLEGDFDLEGEALARLDTQEVFAAIGNLGEELRGVLMLKYAHDLSHKDIGKALGISENNVTVRLHRARKKLATILERGGD
ncbi:MAG: sigma-70 family RNA polymerase sigma factor [Oscillospiraceae bacterium]|nr:sigma-70 family RNA polymerase sigma factor [Oscillospiraceae bacterium]